MKYFGYMPNDFVNGEGISVSFWTTGCPHKCFGCFNQTMWDYNAGYDVPNDINDRVLDALTRNGITRNLSVLGGEPLCPENLNLVRSLLEKICANRTKKSETTAQNDETKVYIWTGYTFEALLARNDPVTNYILSKTDVLIDGKFEMSLRDVSLKLRGSSNQRIIDVQQSLIKGEVVLKCD